MSEYRSFVLEMLDETIESSPLEYKEQLEDVRTLVKARAPLKEVNLVFKGIWHSLCEKTREPSINEYREYCRTIEKATGLRFRYEEGLRIERNNWKIAKRRYPSLFKTDLLFYLRMGVEGNPILGQYSALADQAFIRYSSSSLEQRHAFVEEATHGLIEREAGLTRRMVDYSKGCGILPMLGEVETKLLIHEGDKKKFSEAQKELEKKYSPLSFIINTLNFGLLPKYKHVKKSLIRSGIDYGVYFEMIKTATSYHSKKQDEEEDLTNAISIKTLRLSEGFHNKLVALDDIIFPERGNLRIVIDCSEDESIIRQKIEGFKL